MSELLQSPLGTPVALGKIEGKLRELWELDEASSKASLMNLAVYSERPGALEDNQSIISKITEEQACRVLLIELDREAEGPKAEAWISTHCNLLGGQKSVCSEQIAFQLKGREVGRLRNVVFSHLESDLPLVFWWQGDLSDRFSERLYSLVDRLIIDSSEWSDPLQGFLTIQKAGAWLNGSLVCQDLEWTRAYHHRLAVASLFDEPAAIQILDSLEQVTIVANPQHRLSGLMCVSWLMVQAGWTLRPELPISSSRDENRWLMSQKNGREFEVRLDLNDSVGSLGSLEFRSKNACASVQASAVDGHLKVSLKDGQTSFELLHPAAPVDKGDLVAEQLSRGGKNALFRRMLPQLVELLSINKS